MDIDTFLHYRAKSLHPHLNERQRRLSAAVDALALGYGGISRVAAATGLSRTTIHQGIADLDGEAVPVARATAPVLVDMRTLLPNRGSASMYSGVRRTFDGHAEGGRLW